MLSKANTAGLSCIGLAFSARSETSFKVCLLRRQLCRAYFDVAKAFVLSLSLQGQRQGAYGLEVRRGHGSNVSVTLPDHTYSPKACPQTMVRTRVFIFLAALSVSAQMPATATAQSSIAVDSNFAEYRFKAFSRTRPGMVAKWATRVIDGEINICGVVTYPEWEQRSRLKAKLKRATITLDGNVIMKNLHFFAEVKNERQLDAARAPCRSTNIKAPKGRYTVYIDM